MRIAILLLVAGIVLVAVGSQVSAQSRNPSAVREAPDAAISPVDPIDEVVEKVVYLDQNWDRTRREEFYTLTQGSRLVPYEWFLNLEEAKSQEPFRSVKNMNRYRYLTQKPSLRNPDGLPVGFVKDPSGEGEERDWLGLTCAACHTAQIHFKKVAYRIDGGPALADHDRFLIDLTDAMQTTLKDNTKFERFAKKTLEKQFNEANAQKLRAELASQVELRMLYNERNHSHDESKKPVPYGYARLDAFGRIMNEVMTRHIGLGNENAKSPNAPVSYPHLWDTPHYDRVQWNGVAHNDKLFGPLGRNVGEVLGVFGAVTIPDSKFDPRFRSSVNLKSLRRLEQSVATLWSPTWPTAFGALDAEKVKKGKTLFADHCAKCHATVSDPEDPDRRLTASLHSLEAAGTDDLMALNFVNRTGKTGGMRGRRFFDPKKKVIQIGDNEKAGIMLLGIVNGTIIGSDPADRIVLIREAIDRVREKVRLKQMGLLEGAEKITSLSSFLTLSASKLESLNDQLMSVIGQIHGGKDEGPPLHYKAGSLNGVWATAPYLHNGSVPNLWELLQPPGKRKTTFEVGSREFDPIDVGFKSNGYAERGGFVFDAKVPGNRNGGHDYTKDLNDDDRRALIEYLKSL